MKVLSFLMRYSRAAILTAALLGGLSGGATTLLMVLVNRQLDGSDLTWTSASNGFGRDLLPFTFHSPGSEST